MSPVFADTSFYLALFSRADACHAEALRWSEQNARPVVLTEFILIGLGNALSRGGAIVGMFPRFSDQPAENAALTRRFATLSR